MGLPRCGYHADVDRDESEIPAYKGKIPEGSVCFESGCPEEPTRILGGTCFCEEHFREAKSGAHYRRRVFGEQALKRMPPWVTKAAFFAGICWCQGWDSNPQVSARRTIAARRGFFPTLSGANFTKANRTPRPELGVMADLQFSAETSD